MHADYITLNNGLTILVKETYRTGDAVNCYYLFNDIWVPTTLDINSIANIRSVELDEPELPLFNNFMENHYDDYSDEPPSKFVDIPDTYRYYREGSSSLFTNTESGIQNMLLKSPGGLKGSKPDYGTVVSPVFPKIESDWYYTGFPTKLNVGGADGNLVNFVPIFFYATKDGNEIFTLPKLPDRIGYLDQNNVFTESLSWNGPFKKGALMFTLLLNKDDPSCAGSKLADTSYWSLLTEFSNIDPGSTATKSITISSGITTEQSQSMSLSIGSKISVEAGIEGIAKIAAEFSIGLTASFGTSVSISKQITTTDTVEFVAQPKTQRIATYQFIEQYKINPADPLKQKVANFNDQNKNYIASFAKADFEPRPFDYESRYFAKAFVLEP